MRNSSTGLLIAAFLMPLLLAACAGGGGSGVAVSASLRDSLSGLWLYDAQKTYRSAENLRIMRDDMMRGGMSGSEADKILRQVLPQSIAVMEGGSLEFDFAAKILKARTKTPPPDLQPFSFERTFVVLRSDGGSLTLLLGESRYPSGNPVPQSIMTFHIEKDGNGREVLVAELTNGMKGYLHRGR